MKKLSRIMLTVCMSICMAFSVFAGVPSQDNVVSIDEYTAAIKAEGAKYGIECNILNYDPDVQLTEEMLAYAINNVRVYAKSMKTNEQDVNIVGTSNMISPYSMPVTRNLIGDFTIANLYGTANMRVDANVTIDINNDNVISVNSLDAYQIGAFANFQSWELTNISATKNSPSTGWIKVRVQGRVTFSYADPVTSVTTGYTSKVDRNVNIDCRYV